MNAIEVAQNQFNAWNRHDADVLVAAYGKEGTYRTPRVDHDLSGQAIGDFAKSVWTAFPDASQSNDQSKPASIRNHSCSPP